MRDTIADGAPHSEEHMAPRGDAEAFSGDSLRDALRHVFGFSEFRPNQEEVIAALMQRRDVVAVMPTGSGKSLCYQLPARVLPGTCVVVSPLIALMKDQVDAARDTGLRAAYCNSSQMPNERRDVLSRLEHGYLDLLYVSPERLAMPGFMAELQQAPLSLFAIDEAHCISEWGHDFRPDYLTLGDVVGTFPQTPVAAFTATATPQVQQDVVHRLQLRSPHIVRASFDRPNLFYQVVPKSKPEKQILNFVQARTGDAGIVYRTTRSSVEKTAAFLSEAGIRALPYHAGLEPDVRRRHQEAFSRDQVDVVVATIAFGMGIDKSNIRFVVHGDLPKNIESYYQETGRAGRDGEPASCLLLFRAADIVRIRYFIEQIEDEEERGHALRRMNEMVKFASVNACRRHQLLGYFGENYGKPECGTCDVCTEQIELADATTEAQILMSAIARTRERFGATVVTDIVTGADTQRVRQWNLDKVKTYGAGKDRPKTYWRRILDELLAQQCVMQTTDRFPVLKLTEKGRDVLFGRARFRAASTPGRRALPTKPAVVMGGNVELFEQLRTLRRELAAKRRVPPYVVFSDRALREMSENFPTTEEDMRAISGVGDVKWQKYGAVFIQAIERFLETNPNAAAEPSSV